MTFKIDYAPSPRVGFMIRMTGIPGTYYAKDLSELQAAITHHFRSGVYAGVHDAYQRQGACPLCRAD